MLTIFHVEKQTVKNTIELDGEVTEIDICPEDPEILSFSGPNYFKLFKFNIQEKALEELKEPSADVNEGLHSCSFKDHQDGLGLNISSHCWIKNSKTLVITTKWEIFIFKDYKLWQMIHYEFPEEKVGSIITDKLKDRNYIESHKAGLEQILRMLTRGDNTDLMMKTRKKMNNDGRDIDEDDSEFQNSDSEENPMEEDEGLQDVLDEIKNEKSDKALMIE
jgi:hypothetical protein